MINGPSINAVASLVTLFAVTVISTLPIPKLNGSFTVSSAFAKIVPLASPPRNTRPSTLIVQSTASSPAVIVTLTPKPPWISPMTGSSFCFVTVTVVVSESSLP